MSQASLESIIQQVMTLSPDERRQLRELLDREAASEQSAKEALLRQVQNKYRQLPTGSEAFAARKQEEIDLEDRYTNHQEKR